MHKNDKLKRLEKQQRALGRIKHALTILQPEFRDVEARKDIHLARRRIVSVEMWLNSLVKRITK